MIVVKSCGIKFCDGQSSPQRQNEHVQNDGDKSIESFCFDQANIIFDKILLKMKFVKMYDDKKCFGLFPMFIVHLSTFQNKT